jgi:hypothetical protein
MNRISQNLVGCGSLLLTLAVIAFFWGTDGSQRAITRLFNIAVDIFGSPLSGALALGTIGVAVILIGLSVDLLYDDGNEPGS